MIIINRYDGLMVPRFFLERYNLSSGFMQTQRTRPSIFFLSKNLLRPLA